MSTSETYYQLGILGNPVSQSLSPTMHRFWLNELGLAGDYNAHSVETSDLADRLDHCQSARYRGLNVTIPHKQAVIPYLDTVDWVAQTIGAVNTILFETNGTRRGTNTDADGFSASIPDTTWAQWTQTHGHVLVLGNGGAARAILYTLLQRNVPHIILMARDSPKSQELCAHWLSLSQQTQTTITPITFHDPISRPLDGIISTLPPHAFSCLLPQLIPTLQEHTKPQTNVIDITYQSNGQTPCNQWASKQGLSHQDGLAMLVHQGAQAFELWTDRVIDTPLRQHTIQHLRAST